MTSAAIDPTFESWQERARTLLAAGVPPQHVLWIDRGEAPVLPFGSETVPTVPVPRPSVPRRFLELARVAARHHAADRWALLYRVAWRLVHENRRLLDLELDDDVRQLHGLVQQVRHDVHRMLALLRFHPIRDGAAERLIAWHSPDHDIAALVAPHFAERYPKVQWSIFTPHASVHWAAGTLTSGAGVPRSAIPQADTDDGAEQLWRVYYAAVFNPARLNERKLRRDLPARFWSSLPEAQDIPSLVSGAPARAAEMRGRSGGVTDRAAIPLTADLGALRDAAACCRICPLHERATQTVFGEGPAHASMMIVGEQPGDAEDETGRPFVGPAGAILDRAFVKAGISRADVYLTNAVKHFGWEPRGKWRIHRTPRLSEIRACRPWLEHELTAVRPQVLVLMGGVAARALLGPHTRVTAVRGTILTTPWAPSVVVTYHPSAVLRAADAGTSERIFELLTADLQLAGTRRHEARAEAAG